MAPPPKNAGQPIAPGESNVIADARNMILAPLGWTAVDEKPVGSSSWFWVRIPTNSGGTLTLSHEGGGTLDDQIITSDVDEVQKARKPGERIYEVKAKAGQSVNVLATGGSPRAVNAKFVQIGFARDLKTQTPIVPWNFWYWPTARRFDDKRDVLAVLQMIRKIARAFGKDEKGAEEWEYLNHTADKAHLWVGHCHNAAAASILFEQPVATTIGKEAFSEDELEYLATEWAGNYARHEEVDVFSLRSGVTPRSGRPGEFLPMHFKPGGPKTIEELARAFRGYDGELKPEDAEKLAANLFSLERVDAVVTQQFRELACKFYMFLIRKIRVEGQALVADLRDTNPQHGPLPVWNHALFYYRAEYRQTSPAIKSATDHLDNELLLDIYANEDFAPVSQGSPIVGSMAARHRRSIHVMRFIFDANTGEIVSSDPRNEWKSCKTTVNGPEVYAPDNVREVLRVGSTPTKRQPTAPGFIGTLEIGNPYVELEAVFGNRAPLKLRARYK